MVGIVPGFSVDTPSSGSGPIDPTAFRNAALMKGRVGEAAGSDVANLFQQVADQVQDARNAKMVFDADLALNKTKDQFLTDIQKDPALASDPGKWVPEYKQRIEQTTQAIMGQENLGPAVKRHLSMMTQNFAQQSTTDVTMNALHREAEDTKQAGFESANYDLQTGTYDGLNKATVKYKAMLEAGVIGPKVYAELVKQAPVQYGKAVAANLMNLDPILAPQAIDKIKELDGNPMLKRQLIHEATEGMHAAQEKNGDKFSARMDDDPTHQIPPGLKNARDTDQISEKRYDALVARSQRLIAADAAKTKKEQKEIADEKAKEDRQHADSIGVKLALDDFVGITNPKQVHADYMDQINSVTDLAKRKVLINDLKRKEDAAQKEGKHEDGILVKDQLDEMDKGFKQVIGDIPVTKGTPAVKGWEPFGWGDKEATSPLYAASPKAIEKMDPDKFKDAFPGMTKEQVVKSMNDYVEDKTRRHEQAVKSFLAAVHAPKNKDKVGDTEWLTDQREQAVRQADAAPHKAVTKEEFDQLAPGDGYWGTDGKRYIK